jgi:hypothetical protein
MQAPEILAAVAVLAFEKRQRFRRPVLRQYGPGPEQMQGHAELLDIELPVAAQFQLPPSVSSSGKGRVAVYAPAEVPGLGPGVGIQQVVGAEPLACREVAPHGLAVGAQEQAVVRGPVRRRGDAADLSTPTTSASGWRSASSADCCARCRRRNRESAGPCACQRMVERRQRRASTRCGGLRQSAVAVAREQSRQRRGARRAGCC